MLFSSEHIVMIAALVVTPLLAAPINPVQEPEITVLDQANQQPAHITSLTRKKPTKSPLTREKIEEAEKKYAMSQPKTPAEKFAEEMRIKLNMPASNPSEENKQSAPAKDQKPSSSSKSKRDLILDLAIRELVRRDVGGLWERDYDEMD